MLERVNGALCSSVTSDISIKRTAVKAVLDDSTKEKKSSFTVRSASAQAFQKRRSVLRLSAATQAEIRTAPAVDPNASLIVSPGRPLTAGRSATLV
jgi:hypothetical protein